MGASSIMVQAELVITGEVRMNSPFDRFSLCLLSDVPVDTVAPHHLCEVQQVKARLFCKSRELCMPVCAGAARLLAHMLAGSGSNLMS